MRPWCRGSLALAVVCAGLFASAPAQAGRRAFAFTLDPDFAPSGVVELEQWVWGRVGMPQTKASSLWLWFSPVYGVTDHLELAVPWELIAERGETRITNIGLEARFRFFDRLDEEGLVRPGLRLAIQQNLQHPDDGLRYGVPWASVNLLLSLGQPKGTHATLDAGFSTDFAFGEPQYMTHTLGAGFTWAALDELRLGVEYFHEIGLGELIEKRRWFMVGPALAFSRQRLWASLGVLVGLTATSPVLMPRLAVGITF